MGITEIHYLGIYAVMIKLGISWLHKKHGAIPNNFKGNFCQWKHSAFYFQQANEEQDPEDVESRSAFVQCTILHGSSPLRSLYILNNGNNFMFCLSCCLHICQDFSS